MGAVFRLTGNTVMPAPGVRVLRAADYARLVEANDVPLPGNGLPPWLPRRKKPTRSAGRQVMRTASWKAAWSRPKR